MALRTRWETFDDTPDYRADATAIIRWEALHAIVSEYSNRDRDAYGRSTDYQQEILPLLEFFEKRGAWVRERFGAEIWDEMMDLASAITDRISKLEDFFRAIPEDPAIHRLRSEDFRHIRNRPEAAAGNWFGESVFAGGLWYVAENRASFDVCDEAGTVIAHHDLPEEIQVRDIWLAGNDIYMPCRSYCWPTLFVRYESKQGFVARSALGHAMDPLPLGYWRDIKVRT